LRISLWLCLEDAAAAGIDMHGMAGEDAMMDLQIMALLQGLHLQTVASQEHHVPAGQTAGTAALGQDSSSSSGRTTHS
jgi:hypothetical protein